MSSASVKLDNVCVAHEGHVVLRGVTGCFAPGSVTAIAGPNGAEKSTLLKALMKELPLASGSIDWGGFLGEDFGCLPHATQLDRQFPLTVADTVMLGDWCVSQFVPQERGKGNGCP